MRLSNASRLFFVASAMFISVFIAGQDADAGADMERLFAFGRQPGGAEGTTLLDLDVTGSQVVPTTIGAMTADTNFSGLAFQPGTDTLYVSTGGSGINARNLFTMDPSTGIATLVNSEAPGFGDGAEIKDLEFDAAGVLYGVQSEQLYTIDLATGIATATSDPFHGGSFEEIRMNVLSVDPTTGILYGVSYNDSELFSIETSTGIATSLGVFSTLETTIGALDFGGFDFDSSGNLYIAVGSQVGEIFALDVDDLTVATSLGIVGDIFLAEGGNDIGSISGLRFGPASAPTGPVSDTDGDGDVDGADFLALQRSGGDIATWQAEYGTGVGSVAAISAVPEPTALALLVLGAIGLGSLRGRKS